MLVFIGKSLIRVYSFLFKSDHTVDKQTIVLEHTMTHKAGTPEIGIGCKVTFRASLVSSFIMCGNIATFL